MNEKGALRHQFLVQSGWGTATVTPLAQDASARQYARLTHPTLGTAILMDASGEAAESLGRFIAVTRYLNDLGLSAPQVMHQDLDNGYLILDDFGSTRFADLPAELERLTPIAVDVLLHLQSAPPMAGLPICDANHLAELAATAWEWYPPQSMDAAPVVDAVLKLAAKVDLSPSCTILRDYHAENLMWMPQRDGLQRAGLLDFQDAMLGHPAFDLVSFLQDARRDVDPELERDMIDYTVARSGVNMSDFTASYAALGAIRNLRIIGVFARLTRHMGRADYVDFLPRVWGYLERDLAHPALSELRDLVLETLPEPDAKHLQFLRDTCPTHPQQL